MTEAVPTTAFSAARVVRHATRVLGLAGLLGGIFCLSKTRPAEQTPDVSAAAAPSTIPAENFTTQIRPLDPRVRRARLPLEENRRILSFFDPRFAYEELDHSFVHRQAELILNHLGLTVDYWELGKPLPGPEVMKKYRGVLTWFQFSGLPSPEKHVAWLAAQARAGRKVVVIGDIGAAHEKTGKDIPRALVADVFSALGLTYHGYWTRSSGLLRVVKKDPEMIGFERDLPSQLPEYTHYTLHDSKGVSYLKVERTDRPNSASDVVVTTRTGGFISPGYAFVPLPRGGEWVRLWLVNPFRFLARAFGVEDLPRPDFTTLNGSRIYYSHVDGDGFASISMADHRTRCGDYLREHFLEGYDLPATVSFVTGEIAPPPIGKGNFERLEAARRIARLPNVEVASHGFAHPINWPQGPKSPLSLSFSGYKMDPEKEITFSVNYINRAICPPHKKTAIFLWTGMCNPTAEQLAIPYRLGIYNLNGGDPIMDAHYPSYMRLRPPRRPVGALTQYWTSGPSEFVLAEWPTYPHRWERVVDTYRNSDAPRRVYPINLYHHLYVVDRLAGVRGHHKILQWVLKQQPAPLWATEYIDVVRDFVDLRLARVRLGTDEAWRVVNSGYATTIRFDRTDRYVDLGRSKGVLGYRILQKQQALYVHLDRSPEHLIVLSEVPSRAPYLVRASSYVTIKRLARESAELAMQGYGRKYLTLANLLPTTRFKVSVSGGTGDHADQFVWTDSGGTLDWRQDVNGEVRVAVTPAESR